MGVSIKQTIGVMLCNSYIPDSLINYLYLHVQGMVSLSVDIISLIFLWSLQADVSAVDAA